MERMVVLCILGCIGCGGGGAETPVQKCDDLLNDVCDRGVECVPQQAGTHDSCVQSLQQVLSCGSAKKIGTTYDRCVQQIKGDGCQILFPVDPGTGQPMLTLPADCVGVIEMFEPGGPIGSSWFDGASQLSTGSGPAITPAITP